MSFVSSALYALGNVAAFVCFMGPLLERYVASKGIHEYYRLGNSYLNAHQNHSLLELRRTPDRVITPMA